jgi:hypothetical protein
MVVEAAGSIAGIMVAEDHGSTAGRRWFQPRFRTAGT